MKEMQVIVIVNLTSAILILGLLTKCFLNLFLVGVGIAFPASVGLSWIVARLFQRAKQGKPKGYLKQKLWLWCEDKSVLPKVYIRRSGKWSIGKFHQK